MWSVQGELVRHDDDDHCRMKMFLSSLNSLFAQMSCPSRFDPRKRTRISSGWFF